MGREASNRIAGSNPAPPTITQEKDHEEHDSTDGFSLLVTHKRSKEVIMSRTYRTHLEWRVRAYGRDWTWEEERQFFEELSKELGLKSYWIHRQGWNGHHVVNRKARDNKPWDKPSHGFKQMNRRIERAQVRAAMQAGRDIPVFRKSDQWDWT